MKMQSVNSSNIAAIGYDKEKEVLRVEFNTGGLYDYHNVPESEHIAIMKADSHGKYLNTNIKNNYNFKKINN